jgi:hypothetical protein
MGRACSTNEAKRNVYIGCCWEIQKEIDHWEDQDVRGWIMLQWILDRWDVVIWTGLIKLRIGTRALVNTVMNIRVP